MRFTVIADMDRLTILHDKIVSRMKLERHMCAAAVHQAAKMVERAFTNVMFGTFLYWVLQADAGVWLATINFVLIVYHSLAETKKACLFGKIDAELAYQTGVGTLWVDHKVREARELATILASRI